MRGLLRLLLVLACSLFGAGAYAQDICAQVSAALGNLDLGRGAPLEAAAGVSFEQLYDGCDRTNKYNGQALPSGRKCSSDPNRVDDLLKFPDGTILYRAKMAVDADGSIAAGADPSGQTETWLTFDIGSDRHFVNAEDVPFVVVPLNGMGTRFQGATRIKKGDLAVVLRNGKCSFGVVGDAGPAFRLGEASIKSHEDLGNRQCATAGQHPCLRLKGGGSGVGIGSGVTYILFPGTRPAPLLSQTVVDVAHELASAKALAFLTANAR